jgi:hypothetical protein
MREINNNDVARLRHLLTKVPNAATVLDGSQPVRPIEALAQALVELAPALLDAADYMLYQKELEREYYLTRKHLTHASTDVPPGVVMKVVSDEP